MGLGLDGSDLNQAGVEQHIEHEGNDPGWQDDLLSFDQDGCWTMWNFINCDKKNPIDPQEYHHHDKLNTEGIGKAIVHYES